LLIIPFDFNGFSAEMCAGEMGEFLAATQQHGQKQAINSETWNYVYWHCISQSLQLEPGLNFAEIST
jgi:hypothetical protein